MKKSLWIAALVLALTAGVVGTAYAEESSLPPGPGGPGHGAGEGPLHDPMGRATPPEGGLPAAFVQHRSQSRKLCLPEKRGYLAGSRPSTADPRANLRRVFAAPSHFLQTRPLASPFRERLSPQAGWQEEGGPGRKR